MVWPFKTIEEDKDTRPRWRIVEHPVNHKDERFVLQKLRPSGFSLSGNTFYDYATWSKHESEKAAREHLDKIKARRVVYETD